MGFFHVGFQAFDPGCFWGFGLSLLEEGGKRSVILNYLHEKLWRSWVLSSKEV